MRSIRTLVFVGITLAVLAWTAKRLNPKPVAAEQVPRAQTDIPLEPSPISGSGSKPAPPVQARPIPRRPEPQEMASLKIMVTMLSDFANSNRTLENLVSQLNSEHSHPFLVQQHNDSTGDLTIVRTNSPLPGTRYFHAQYFGTRENQFLQHMSFEFEPGPSAMSDAEAAVMSSFRISAHPEFADENFKRWRLPDGYVVWIKRLDKDDLGDNPFNAYAPADEGTIKVAVEIDPEGGAE